MTDDRPTPMFFRVPPSWRKALRAFVYRPDVPYESMQEFIVDAVDRRVAELEKGLKK
jgi:hypothetical protein